MLKTFKPGHKKKGKEEVDRPNHVHYENIAHMICRNDNLDGLQNY
jgi:hypothetical protein